MASAIQEAVAAVQENDYGTLVILIAIGYDYILTLSDEIEYIWNKPWTWVSTLFFLARYFGLCSVITMGLFGSSFLPGPTMVYVPMSHPMCVNINSGKLIVFKQFVVLVFNQWTTTIFFAAADLVMILRVWALYGQSWFILAALLPLYATEVISYLILSAVLSDARHYPQGAVYQVLNFSTCGPNYSPVTLLLTSDAVQMSLSVLTCLFVAIRYVNESFRMYRVTKKFQLSSYMKILARQSMLYFLSILALSLINMMFVLNVPLNSMIWVLVQYIPAFTLVPRLTLSLRKKYARELVRKDGSGIDTAFGLKSAGHDAVPSAVLFADSFGVTEEYDQSHAEVMMEERVPRNAPGV